MQHYVSETVVLTRHLVYRRFVNSIRIRISQNNRAGSFF